MSLLSDDSTDAYTVNGEGGDERCIDRALGERKPSVVPSDGFRKEDVSKRREFHDSQSTPFFSMNGNGPGAGDASQGNVQSVRLGAQPDG